MRIFPIWKGESEGAPLWRVFRARSSNNSSEHEECWRLSKCCKCKWKIPHSPSISSWNFCVLIFIRFQYKHLFLSEKLKAPPLPNAFEWISFLFEKNYNENLIKGSEKLDSLFWSAVERESDRFSQRTGGWCVGGDTRECESRRKSVECSPSSALLLLFPRISDTEKAGRQRGSFFAFILPYFVQRLLIMEDIAVFLTHTFMRSSRKHFSVKWISPNFSSFTAERECVEIFEGEPSE